MINITHSVGGLSTSLLVVLLGLTGDASIWVILLSIYLWQVMDIDTEDSSISQKLGWRSIGVGIRMMVSWHRKETHSFFFAFLFTLFISPILVYISYIDGSSIFSNFLLSFLAISSHALLDMGNTQGVPLFYFPKFNPVRRAKEYTLKDIKMWGIEVGGSQEFSFVTLPLVLLCLILFFLQFSLFYEKILDGSELILSNIPFSLFLLVYSLWDNYLFKAEWGFKDFLYSFYTGIKNNDISQIYWDSLWKILWESNFTKILTSLLLLFSIGINGFLYLEAVGDFFMEKINIFLLFFEGEGNIISRFAEVIHNFSIRFFY